MSDSLPPKFVKAIERTAEQVTKARDGVRRASSDMEKLLKSSAFSAHDTKPALTAAQTALTAIEETLDLLTKSYRSAAQNRLLLEIKQRSSSETERLFRDTREKSRVFSIRCDPVAAEMQILRMLLGTSNKDATKACAALEKTWQDIAKDYHKASAETLNALSLGNIDLNTWR